MTPREQVERELAEELGWWIEVRANDGTPCYYTVEHGELGPSPPETATLWYLLVTDRLKMKELQTLDAR